MALRTRSPCRQMNQCKDLVGLPLCRTWPSPARLNISSSSPGDTCQMCSRDGETCGEHISQQPHCPVASPPNDRGVLCCRIPRSRPLHYPWRLDICGDFEHMTLPSSVRMLYPPDQFSTWLWCFAGLLSSADWRPSVSWVWTSLRDIVSRRTGFSS